MLFSSKYVAEMIHNIYNIQYTYDMSASDIKRSRKKYMAASPKKRTATVLEPG